MQNRPILIGSGFYADANDISAKFDFFKTWMLNTTKALPAHVVVVDNSESGLPRELFRTLRVYNNLGHATWPIAQAMGTPLIGWSMSWIITALIAYSEKCDFVYKEQDCLAFGDWLPIIRRGSASIGRNSIMPCEQSLFYVRHEFILPMVRDYIGLGGHDCQIVSEDKFRRLMDSSCGMIEFHNLPGGRERPMPDLSKPFYLQKITDNEMNILKSADLL